MENVIAGQCRARGRGGKHYLKFYSEVLMERDIFSYPVRERIIQTSFAGLK